jgi:hypothetical protein
VVALVTLPDNNILQAGIKGEREIVDSSVVRKASISSTWLIGFVLRLLRSESAEKLKL